MKSSAKTWIRLLLRTTTAGNQTIAMPFLARPDYTSGVPLAD